MSITQPDKVHLQENTDPQWGAAVALLQELREVFAVHAADFNALVKQAVDAGDLDPQPMQYLQELADCVQIMASRAKHVSVFEEK